MPERSIKKLSRSESTKIELSNKRQTRSQTKELISAFENLNIEHAGELIFQKGIDPSVINSKLLTRSLCHAVKIQNTPLVRELLKYQPNLTTDEEPLLMIAIKQLNFEIAMMLINAGVDVNEFNYLHTIALCQDSKMHQLIVPLIEHGADLKVLDSHNRSVLYCAIENKALIIVEELLRRGVRISDNDEQILSLAANSIRAAEILQLFFRYNCISFEMRDQLALKAMFNFIEYEYDNVDGLKMLLDLDVPVDQINDQGITALHYAVNQNRIKMVELLLSYGADVNKKTYRGTTPIMIAVTLSEPTIAVLLIKRGANIHDCNNSGRYPIHLACNRGITKNIRLLICLGANVDVIDQWDFTPFSLLDDKSTENNLIFLKHFAFLTTNGIALNSTDLAMIQSDGYMSKIYNTCLTELHRMKDTQFMNGVSYYDLINGKIEKLSMLTRNSEFVKQFYKDQRNANGKRFRWLKYSRELIEAFQMAERRRDLLIAKEILIRNAFGNCLTDVVLDIIARYSLINDLSDFKKNFYLSLFCNGNGR